MFAPVINFARLHAGEIWPLCRRLWRTDGSHYRHLYYPLHCVQLYLRASHEHRHNTARRVCKTSDRTTMLRSQRSEVSNGFFSALFMQNDVTRTTTATFLELKIPSMLCATCVLAWLAQLEHFRNGNPYYIVLNLYYIVNNDAF
jgi:hypothetical protein